MRAKDDEAEKVEFFFGSQPELYFSHSSWQLKDAKKNKKYGIEDENGSSKTGV